jgi:hypothetical protein
MTSNPTPRGRAEGLVLTLILLTVAGFAGAASFTHVHDWTMHNSPPGTPGWFGWANAVISELVPIAALLTIRQRRRTSAPIGYPMTLLAFSAGLSLSAQLAVAKPGPSGWLLSAVPAIAFMALAKLVLAPVKTTSKAVASTEVDDHAPAGTNSEPASSDDLSTNGSTPSPEPAPHVPAQLRPVAQFAAVNHHQHTGRPITVDELAARMTITPATARLLLADIQPTPLPATTSDSTQARINGAPVLDSTATGGAR